MYKLILFLLCSVFALQTNAQELNARVTVSATQVSSTVNKSAFTTLQNALNTFLNSRKWSKDVYGTNEKIDCTFFLNLSPSDEANVYTGSLTIQAARPIFNSSYLSPLINFKDDDITFKYVEFQQIEFNEARVSGADGLVSNLSAIFAYYANMIIAFDNESFSLRGGEASFLKAQNIVNNAPEARGVKGWRLFDGRRSRYWLINDMLNTNYAIMHDVYYNYYRMSMDKFYEDEVAARAELLNTINLLSVFNTNNPNTMINQFFFQGKANEIIKAFAKAPPQDKARAADLLSKMDLTNAANYKDQLK
jgi:Domain of unknown function (DUF4835)